MSVPSSAPHNGVSYLYMTAAFVVVVAGIKAAEAIINPLLLAVFLAIISAPAYFGLLRRGFSEWLSLLIVITGLTLIGFGLLYFLVGSITSFTARQDHYRSLILERNREIRTKFDTWIPDWARPAADTEPKSDPETRAAEPNPIAESTASDSESAAADLQSGGLKIVVEDPDSGSGAATERPTAVSANEPDSLTGSETVTVVEDEFGSGGRDTDSLEDLLENLDQNAMDPDTVIHIYPEQPEREPADSLIGFDFVYSQFDPGTALRLAARLAGSLGQLLSNGFLILLTVIFILLEVSSFSKKLNAAFVATNDDTSARASQIVNSIQDYLAIKTLMSLLTGGLIFFWLLVFRIPYAGLWGLLAFLLNYIPNVGSVIAAIPAVLIAWLELGTLPALATVTGYVIVNTAIGNFLEPRLMGRSLGLSVLVVFCSMVFWGWVLGPVGMLLSVPLTMTARIALEGFEDTRWLAILLGNADSLTAPAMSTLPAAAAGPLASPTAPPSAPPSEPSPPTPPGA